MIRHSLFIAALLLAAPVSLAQSPLVAPGSNSRPNETAHATRTRILFSILTQIGDLPPVAPRYDRTPSRSDVSKMLVQIRANDPKLAAMRKQFDALEPLPPGTPEDGQIVEVLTPLVDRQLAAIQRSLSDLKALAEAIESRDASRIATAWTVAKQNAILLAEGSAERLRTLGSLVAPIAPIAPVKGALAEIQALMMDGSAIVMRHRFEIARDQETAASLRKLSANLRAQLVIATNGVQYGTQNPKDQIKSPNLVLQSLKANQAYADAGERLATLLDKGSAQPSEVERELAAMEAHSNEAITTYYRAGKLSR